MGWLTAPHRLTCLGRGHVAEWVPGRVLWAYNVPHLELLEEYVAAAQRERPRPAGSQTLLERLPV
ncbi:hypothetical protein [Nonomuraea sp. NPDC049129]|uniref:hypothetical protein n=1 Tax=Nonomuraea sp. NPDC049129 TaxID=3155272 RepID=UPI00340FD16F